MVAKRSGGQLNGAGSQAEARPAVQHGDARAGFEMWLDRSDGIVQMRLRGVWDIAMANEFLSSIARVATERAGHPWAFVTDATEYPVQSPEVAEIRRAAIAICATHGCEKIATIAASTMYAMQLKRIVGESHLKYRVFLDEKSAFVWIRQGRHQARDDKQVSAAQRVDHPRNRRRSR